MDSHSIRLVEICSFFNLIFDCFLNWIKIKMSDQYIFQLESWKRLFRNTSNKFFTKLRIGNKSSNGLSGSILSHKLKIFFNTSFSLHHISHPFGVSWFSINVKSTIHFTFIFEESKVTNKVYSLFYKLACILIHVQSSEPFNDRHFICCLNIFHDFLSIFNLLLWVTTICEEMSLEFSHWYLEFWKWFCKFFSHFFFTWIEL